MRPGEGADIDEGREFVEARDQHEEGKVAHRIMVAWRKRQLDEERSAEDRQAAGDEKHEEAVTDHAPGALDAAGFAEDCDAARIPPEGEGLQHERRRKGELAGERVAREFGGRNGSGEKEAVAAAKAEHGEAAKDDRRRIMQRVSQHGA